MIEQRSAEWFEIRRGKPSASRFNQIVKADGTTSRSQDRYAQELALARLGYEKPRFSNAAMEVGVSREPLAVSAFEIITGMDTQEASFVLADCGRYGASPDRHIGSDAVLEIKCPMDSTHTKTLERGEIPSKYIPQLRGQMLITDSSKGWFMSYHPDYDAFITSIERAAEWDRLFMDEMSRFLDEVDVMEKGAIALSNFLKG